MSDKLAGVHPLLVSAVGRIQAAMQALGFTMIVTDGVRTVAEQAALYAKGRTAPGHIVTNCDGELKRSNHQPHADGFGHAVDLTFMDDHGTPIARDDDFPSWDEKKFPFGLYGAMAKALHLRWGGDWNAPHDTPHIELPDA